MFDYIFLAKYPKSFKLLESSRNIFIKTNHSILEFKIIQKYYPIYHSKYRTFKFDNLTFNVYKKKLQILEDSKLISKIKSDQNIIICNLVFMVILSENTALIINEKGNTFNVFYRDDIIYFTRNGIIFYVEREQILNKNICKCYECWHIIKNKTLLYQGHLSMISNENITKNFTKETIPLKIGDLSIYREMAEIKDILNVSSFTSDNFKEIVIVLTTSALFLLCEDIIIKKPQKVFRYIVASRFIIHNYVQEESFANLLIYFNIFQLVKNEIMLSTVPENEIIQFYFEKCKNKDLEAHWIMFISNIKEISPITLCKSYRILDDKGKSEIIKFLNFKLLDCDSLNLLIQYHPENLELLVDKCIEESKLYLLKDLCDYYKKIEQYSQLNIILLSKNILMDKVEGYEDIYEMQMYEIEAQKAQNANLSSCTNPIIYRQFYK